jgi:hypothetical protein
MTPPEPRTAAGQAYLQGWQAQVRWIRNRQKHGTFAEDTYLHEARDAILAIEAEAAALPPASPALDPKRISDWFYETDSLWHGPPPATDHDRRVLAIWYADRLLGRLTEQEAADR